MVHNSRHDPVHRFGAICPARGVGAAIIMPAVNTEAMNEHLAEISSQVAPGARALLICTVPAGISAARILSFLKTSHVSLCRAIRRN
jgi:hypothetical protein